MGSTGSRMLRWSMPSAAQSKRAAPKPGRASCGSSNGGSPPETRSQLSCRIALISEGSNDVVRQRFARLRLFVADRHYDPRGVATFLLLLRSLSRYYRRAARGNDQDRTPVICHSASGLFTAHGTTP